MASSFSKNVHAPLLAAVIFAGCIHTPPGTSVEVALARRAEVVSYPSTPAPASRLAALGPKAPLGPVSAQGDKAELVADAYSRGEFCLDAGKDEEAIAAFREAVKIDPNFVDAWNKLAALYERTGQDKLAMEAFRKSKSIAKQP